MASNNSVEKPSIITTVSTGEGWRGAERDRRLDPMHRLVTGDRVTISGGCADHQQIHRAYYYCYDL